MLAISGLSSIFTWGSICLCHIRFRKAWKQAGHTLDELAFKSQAGVWGSWLGLIMNCLILVAQFWTGFAPVGYASMSAMDRVESFFEVYLAAPIVIVLYFGFKAAKRTRIRRISDIDLTSGRRELDLEEILKEERAMKAQWPLWKKVFKTVC